MAAMVIQRRQWWSIGHSLVTMALIASSASVSPMCHRCQFFANWSPMGHHFRHWIAIGAIVAISFWCWSWQWDHHLIAPSMRNCDFWWVAWVHHWMHRHLFHFFAIVADGAICEIFNLLRSFCKQKFSIRDLEISANDYAVCFGPKYRISFEIRQLWTTKTITIRHVPAVRTAVLLFATNRHILEYVPR